MSQTADQLVEWKSTPKLKNPLMVVALEGLFDAGCCATGAVDGIKDHGDCTHIATIDPDEFYDFQETRPEISFAYDASSIAWPAVAAHVVTGSPKHDLVMVTGIEPRMLWRTFCESLLEIATRTKCQMIITLGATPENVPHTRPPKVTGSAANSSLAARLGLSAPSYEGPTGVIGTFHSLADEADLPVISLRVGVPYYVAGPPNPKGTRALLAEFEWITGIKTDPHQLDDDVAVWEQRVSEAVSDEPSIVAYIEGLEREADERLEREMPSAEQIGSQVEAFLAERSELSEPEADPGDAVGDADADADAEDEPDEPDEPSDGAP